MSLVIPVNNVRFRTRTSTISTAGDASPTTGLVQANTVLSQAKADLKCQLFERDAAIEEREHRLDEALRQQGELRERLRFAEWDRAKLQDQCNELAHQLEQGTHALAMTQRESLKLRRHSTASYFQLQESRAAEEVAVRAAEDRLRAGVDAERRRALGLQQRLSEVEGELAAQALEVSALEKQLQESRAECERAWAEADEAGQMLRSEQEHGLQLKAELVRLREVVDIERANTCARTMQSTLSSSRRASLADEFACLIGLRRSDFPDPMTRKRGALGTASPGAASWAEEEEEQQDAEVEEGEADADGPNPEVIPARRGSRSTPSSASASGSLSLAFGEAASGRLALKPVPEATAAAPAAAAAGAAAAAPAEAVASSSEGGQSDQEDEIWIDDSLGELSAEELRRAGLRPIRPPPPTSPQPAANAGGGGGGLLWWLSWESFMGQACCQARPRPGG